MKKFFTICLISLLSFLGFLFPITQARASSYGQMYVTSATWDGTNGHFTFGYFPSDITNDSLSLSGGGGVTLCFTYIMGSLTNGYNATCYPYNGGDTVVNNGDGTVTITAPGANYQGSIGGYQFNSVEGRVYDATTDTVYYTDGTIFGFNTQPSSPYGTPPPYLEVNPLSGGVINEGDTYTENGSFTDPTATSWTATVDYGDGSSIQPVTLNADHTFALSHQYLEEGTTTASQGTFTVKVTVTNNLGVSASETATVTVRDQISNYGQMYVTSATWDGTNGHFTFGYFPDDITNHDFSSQKGYEVDLCYYSQNSYSEWVGNCYPYNANGTVVNNGDGTITFTAPGANFQGSIGGYQFNSIAASVEDFNNDTLYYTDPTILGFNTKPILNNPPVVAPLPNATLNEGDVYSTTDSFSDVDASTSWTATVDYGDGSGTQSLGLNADKSFSLSHQYLEEGTYTVTIAVSDNQGATGTTTSTITVNDVNPSVTIPSPSVNPAQVNSPVSFTSTFTDPGTLDTHTATWNWGDGTTCGGNPDPCLGTVTESNGSGSVTNSHTYTSAGVYTVSLTVSDGDGGVTTQTFQYLSVYNPTSQGIFSAGNIYNSPAGAYTQNTSATGVVRFGLSYKYQGTIPVGDRQFAMNFKTANLNFSATSVSSLVIANGIGTLTGTGTINGSGNYNFLVTGSESTNTIRIQIVDPSNNNAVIYDTQPGQPATATPTTNVTGQVIAH